MLDLLAEGAEHAGEHATAFGIAPDGWVAIAMLVVFAIMLRAGVPGIIARLLDDRIAGIRSQLDEAAKLREEAVALRDRYQDKIAGAEKEVAEVMAQAQTEAEALLAKAEADSKALVERRKRMAEEKIAAAQRDAVDDVRRRAVEAATTASQEIIAEQHDEKADAKLADEVIASI